MRIPSDIVKNARSTTTCFCRVASLSHKCRPPNLKSFLSIDWFWDGDWFRRLLSVSPHKVLMMDSVKHLLAIFALVSVVISDGLPVPPCSEDGVSICYRYMATFTETDWVYVTSTACPCPSGPATSMSTNTMTMSTLVTSSETQLIRSGTVIAISNPTGSSTTSDTSSPTSSSGPISTSTEYVDAVLLHHDVHCSNHSAGALTWSEQRRN
jgi:hypothetical protein